MGAKDNDSTLIMQSGIQSCNQEHNQLHIFNILVTPEPFSSTFSQLPPTQHLFKVSITIDLRNQDSYYYIL